MLWIRGWYKDINQDWLRGRIIIHGHTPIARSIILERFKNVKKWSAIDIDAGCVYDRKGMHQLCAYNLDNKTFVFQENVDD
jgi:serine/threonine protein phosphatase 1